jgi:hypothetical protein
LEKVSKTESLFILGLHGVHQQMLPATSPSSYADIRCPHRVWRSHSKVFPRERDNSPARLGAAVQAVNKLSRLNITEVAGSAAMLFSMHALPLCAERLIPQTAWHASRFGRVQTRILHSPGAVRAGKHLQRRSDASAAESSPRKLRLTKWRAQFQLAHSSLECV